MHEKNKNVEVEDIKKEIKEESKSHLIEDDINTRKRVFSKSFTTYRAVNAVLLVLTIIIVTLSYIFLFPIGTNGMWATFIIIAVLVMGMFVYSALMKRSITKKASTYMSDYYRITSDYVYDDTNIKNYRISSDKQMTLEHFTKAHLIKDVIKAGSRNYVEYEFNGQEFVVSDYIAYRGVNKTTEPIFLGKLLVASIKKPLKNRIVIYRRPDEESYASCPGPNDVDDLTKVLENKKLIIYAKDEEALKYLPAKALEILENIETNKTLADISIVFDEERITVAFSYGDDLMVVPLREPFYFSSQTKFKEDLKAVHEFIKLTQK
ncbi:MAG: hypothetical protein QM205_01430 [Bacillota bacterium]|jgi:hypothetical protein|nr:hypothetical protein [Bacillota bacterium]